MFYLSDLKPAGVHIIATIAMGNAIRHPPKVGRVGNRLQKTTY